MLHFTFLPRAVSAGIWRPVRLQWRPGERIEDVYVETVRLAEDHGSATLRCTYRLATDPKPDGRYEFAFPMVVGPRYVGGGEALPRKSGAGWGKDTTRIPDASRITPPVTPVSPPEPGAPAVEVAPPPPEELQPWDKVMAPASSRATEPRMRASVAFRVLVRIATSMVSSKRGTPPQNRVWKSTSRSE